jgi:hypothetical protein
MFVPSVQSTTAVKAVGSGVAGGNSSMNAGSETASLTSTTA